MTLRRLAKAAYC